MTAEIQWLTDGVELPPLDYELVRRWIVRMAESYGRMAHTLNYIFCSDERIIEVNRRFLNHDYYTDIITFDNCSAGLLRGDMYISLDTVASNAAALGVDAGRELHRVIIHGVLHLCGINDKGPGEREIMEAAEERALATLDTLAGEQL